MKKLKLCQSDTSSKNFLRAIYLSLAILSSSVGVLCTHQTLSFSSEPKIAYIAYFTDGIRVLLYGEEEKTPQEYPELKRYEDRLKVPATPKVSANCGLNSDNCEFSHLSFKSIDKDQNNHTPLIQAGPNYTESLYYFPCKFDKGDFIVGWNIERVGTDKNQCDGIEVKNDEIFKSTKSYKKQINAQNNSKNITISPNNNLTLIYIDNNDNKQKIYVLLGEIDIQSPTSSFSLKKNESYFNNGKQEGKEKLRPVDIYSTQIISIFLNQNYWLEEVRIQVQDFKNALESDSLTKMVLESPRKKIKPESEIQPGTSQWQWRPVNETDKPSIVIPDTRIPDTTIPDIRIPDTTIPDTTIPDTRIPDTTIPDTRIPDTTIPDTTTPDTTTPLI